MLKGKGWKKAMPSLIAIAIGLVVGLLVIYFTKPSTAFSAIPQFLMGPFNRGLTGLGDLLYHALPILMTGLAVGFAYQTGLFNIGASGQFMLGGFLAILFCAKFERYMPKSFTWIIALLISGLGGGFIAAIVGWLKAKRNVNEVITCIMLNYTVMYVINHLIKSLNIYNQLKNNTVHITTSIPKMGLDFIFPRTISGGGFIIAIILAIFLNFILHKTTFGYEIKGVGLNKHAAKYAGINGERSIILSMTISGIMAGLGGGMVYLSGAGNHMSVQEILPQEGFDGIAVALLGLNEPIGVIMSALFFAYMRMGGQAIQTLGFAPELITMIISFILYVSALSELFRRLLNRKKDTITDNDINSVIIDDISKNKEVKE